MKYAYRDGVRLPVKAQVVGETLEAIRTNQGRITPPIVVQESRPDEAPLHPCFEWDDPRAAELYREEQARHIIQCVYPVNEETGETEPYRYLHNVVIEDERCYEPIDVIMSDEDLLEQVLAEAMTSLQTFRRKYGHLAKLAGVCREIDRVAAELAEPPKEVPPPPKKKPRRPKAPPEKPQPEA